ncbi:MAG: UPF0149 family protein [Gammaproteobacteria bacterium]
MAAASPSPADPVAQLAAFLAAPARPAGTLDLCQLSGFLFTVVTAPELVSSGDWIPAVFNDAEPNFASEDESVQVFHALMEVYNATVTNAQASHPQLPACCAFGADAVADCAPDAPVARWSQGFHLGYEWLVELWDTHLPEELADAHEDDLYCLTFFAGATELRQEIVTRARRSRRDPELAVRREAEAVRDGFAAALARYAARGRQIYEYQLARAAQRTPVRSAKTGRNEPCPCGSGKKYKKCCGAAGG